MATSLPQPIEGAISPEPHPSFIDLFYYPPFCGGARALEGAGEDAPAAPEGAQPFIVPSASDEAGAHSAPSIDPPCGALAWSARTGVEKETGGVDSDVPGRGSEPTANER
jgi:hypothetical protein